MSKALEVANEILAEVSALISDDLVKECGFNSVKEMMIDAITNKTPRGKIFAQMFVDKFGSADEALAAIKAIKQ